MMKTHISSEFSNTNSIIIKIKNYEHRKVIILKRKI